MNAEEQLKKQKSPLIHCNVGTNLSISACDAGTVSQRFGYLLNCPHIRQNARAECRKSFHIYKFQVNNYEFFCALTVKMNVLYLINKIAETDYKQCY